MDCLVGDCNGSVHALDLCKKHYTYLRKHGSVATVRTFTCSVCGKEWEQAAKPGRPPTVCSKECFKVRARCKAKDWMAGNPKRVANHPSRQTDAARRYYESYYARNREREIARAVQYQRDHPEWKAALDARRYALTKGAPEAELFTLNEIYQRDDKTCHICGGSVDRKDATIDHLIPVTKDGPHTRANVGLAHRGCNARKGDRITA